MFNVSLLFHSHNCIIITVLCFSKNSKGQILPSKSLCILHLNFHVKTCCFLYFSSSFIWGVYTVDGETFLYCITTSSNVFGVVVAAFNHIHKLGGAQILVIFKPWEVLFMSPNPDPIDNKQWLGYRHILAFSLFH